MSSLNGNAQLEIENIDVFYGPIQALRGVSLRIEEGEMVAIIGANGAGKTSTLRAISGLLAPKSGQIRFKGSSIAGKSPHQVVRRGVAHVPEGRELFPDLSVLENLRLGSWSKRKQRKAYSNRLEAVFQLFPKLRERSGQQAKTMSGGEQQMLTVARGLMSGPDLLLVDELSLGLAPMVVEQLFEALKAINREGTSVVLVEQFVHLALGATNRAYALAKGEVALEGKSSDLLANPDLVASYLGESGMPEGSARATTASDVGAISDSPNGLASKKRKKKKSTVSATAAINDGDSSEGGIE